MLFVDQDPSSLPPDLVKKLKIVEIRDGEGIMPLQRELKAINPDLVVSVMMPMAPGASERILKLIDEGVEVIHLQADEFGIEEGTERLFVKDRMKQIHLRLGETGVRDQVTLLAGGGVAMAEHLAKLIICGADALMIDIPLLVAMECRVCRRCKQDVACPVQLDSVDPQWGGARITNLMAGWQNQLLEILGAMGIREARRLRGEMGRAMFFEDLEKELFATMGKRG